MTRLLLALFSVIVITVASSADYVEVRRSATIRELPNSDAQIIARPEIGAQLPLLDEGKQSNGWYRVFIPNHNVNGWIYRTRVRRYPGDVTGLVQPSISGGVASLTGDDVMRAHFINMGQGDATLLEFPCGLVLIDAGGRLDRHKEHLKNYIQKVMDRTGKSVIDTVFVTHTHTDHNRSLQEVVENFSVRNYVHNGVYDGSGRYKARWMRDHANDNGRSITDKAVKQAALVALPNRNGLNDDVIDPLTCADVRVLSGHYEENTASWPSGEFENGNNKGISIRVDYGQSSFLFTGDMEEHAIDTLVDYYHGTSMLDVDVYQSGHHGSYNGTTEHLLQAMTPEKVIMSFGPYTIEESWTAWAYGHPRLSLVNMLDAAVSAPRSKPKTVYVAPGTKTFIPFTMNDAIYATGWDGDIVIEAKPSGQMVVQTAR